MNFRPIYFFLVICALLLPSATFAQNNDNQDLTGLSLEDLSRISLYTASRHLEDPRKAPSAVTVVDREEIIRYGWHTMGDLLRSVPGFYTAYDRTYTYVGVRGFLQSGDYNARILLLIDGHRINENIYDSALVGTEFPLDLDLIDHVEIVRGPGSSLFGTNAELAVVSVFTRRPEQQLTLDAVAEMESFLGRTGEATVSFRTNRYNGIVSASLYRSNGVAHLYLPEFDAPDTNDGVADYLDGDRYDHVFAVIHRGQLRVEGMYSSRLKIVPNASYQTTFNDPNNRTTDTRGFADVSYNRTFGDSTELDLRAYYDGYRFLGSYPYGKIGSSDRSLQINLANADWIGFESVLGHRLGKHRIVAGTTGEYNFRLDQKNYNIGQSPFLNDHRTLGLAAFFGEAELNLHPKLSLNLGGRIDWYRSYGTATSPRIALMYLPTARTSLKYIFGHAFRAPDPYDEFYTDDMGITFPSKNLIPEDIESNTLLLEHTFAPWLQLTADIFENVIDNVIREQQDRATGLTSFVNASGDRSRGLEVDLNLKNVSGWSGRTSYTYTRTKEEQGGIPVMNSPSNLAKLNAAAPVAGKGFLGLELLYAGSQQNFYGARVSSSFLTNMTFSSRPMRSGLAFSASCNNVFDRRWYTPTGPESMELATQQDGRTWRFRIGYRRSFHSQRGSR
jgi:outer membrane receptor for ferrienterochelin and colicins